MAHSRSHTGHSLMNDYMNLRSIPALLGVIFVLASLYQFGGISSVEIVWLDYQLTTHHAMLLSLAVYVVAFASSETKRFESYQSWEQLMIVVGPVLLIGHQHIDMIADMIATEGHTGPIIAFIVAMISYAVAVGK